MKLVQAATAGYRSMPKSAQKKRQKLSFRELALRKKLAKEWEQLSEEERMALRVQRAKAGIKCNICGAVGYYRETCPKKCTVADILFKDEPPDDDDDEDYYKPKEDPPNIGVVWGDGRPAGHHSALREEPVDSDLGRLRERMYLENAHLKEADRPLERYQFFVKGEDGYNRNIGELTLHQVLRYLVRVVDHDMLANQATLQSRLDLTLFHPPGAALKEDFYPDEVAEIPEYREYFYSLKNKPDKIHRSYNNRSHMRPTDMLDPAFRGGDVHGDRSLFLPNPDAAQPVHSKLGWKALTATNDSLANSDPVLAAKHEEFKKNFQKQSEWVEKQGIAMRQNTDRYAHLALIIREEIQREHGREARMLKVPFNDRKGLHALSRELWRERIDAADRIMGTLKAYHIGSSGSSEADYLIFCLDEWIKFSSKGQKSFATENARYAKYGKADDSVDEADEGSLIRKLKGKNAGGGKKKNKHKVSEEDSITSSQQALVQTYMTADMMKYRDRETALVAKYKKEAEEYRVALEEEREVIRNQDAVATQRRDAMIAKRMATLSFDQMEKPAKFETRSLAGLSVNERLTDRSSATSAVVAEGVPSITMSARLLEDKSDASKKRTTKERLATGLDNSRSIRLVAKDGADDASEVSALSNGMREAKASQSLVLRTKNVPKPASPPPEKRVFVSQKMRDRAKMKETASVFKVMGMGKHIRRGDFKDSTQRTPVLIPLHKVLEVDAPEDEMRSYSAVRDVYHQRTKYANKVTGMTREKLVPLFARTTLVEKNGVTPGGDQRYADMADNRRYSYLLGRAMSALEPKGTKHNDPH